MSSFACPHCGTTLHVVVNAKSMKPDQITQFLTESCELDPANRESMGDVLAAYAEWCRRRGQFALSPKAFGNRLRLHPEIQTARSNGRRYYRGVRLLG